jgi:hypothetical protein
LLLLVMVGAIGLAVGEAYRYLRKVRALWRVEVAANQKVEVDEGLTFTEGRTVPAKEEEHGA